MRKSFAAALRRMSAHLEMQAQDEDDLHSFTDALQVLDAMPAIASDDEYVAALRAYKGCVILDTMAAEGSLSSSLIMVSRSALWAAILVWRAAPKGVHATSNA